MHSEEIVTIRKTPRELDKTGKNFKKRKTRKNQKKPEKIGENPTESERILKELET